MLAARRTALPLALALSLVAPRSLADPTPPQGPLAPLAPSAPTPPAPDDSRELRFTSGIALGGVGFVTIVLASVLGVRALIDKNKIGTHCNQAFQCDLTGYTFGSDARDMALLSTVTFIAGIAGAAAGVGIIVSAVPKKPGAARVTWIAPAPGGFIWGARF